MIGFQEAKAIAEKQMPDMVVDSCTDIGSAFVFAFRMEDGEVFPGTPFIVVSKEEGNTWEMAVPPIENLEILEAGREIEIE